MESTLPAHVCFGGFDLDLKTGELRGAGQIVRLSEKPFRVLVTLVEHGGELVTREDIQKKLWPNDTAVDFEHGINTVIKNLRRVLGDSVEEPKYIETLARRGYRLLAAVEPTEAAAEEHSTGDGTALRMQPETVSLIGKQVSHYRVLEVIGRGGMGLVYKAEDLKLGRRVALKFLPEELASDDLALQRFEHEARTASSLNHRNICTIYEIEEHEQQPFIVMELLEGETLRDCLAAADEQVSPNRLLEIAIQIAEGLQAAHEKGVIHRDIKPANIFLTTSGQVKILDFGLAKRAISGEEIGDKLRKFQPLAKSGEKSGVAPIAQTLTRTGVDMGTAGYMSPEQVRKEKLDARSDLFSFGLVLYEMATGWRAFSGDTAAIVHNAILHSSQVPIRELNSALPPKLVTIIDKALQKDREQRCQSAAEMGAELRALQPHRATRSRGSRWILVGAVGVVLGVAGFFMTGSKTSNQEPARQPTLRQLTPLSVDSPVLDSITLSPDGKHLAYLDRAKGVSLLQIDTGENRSLPNTTSFVPNRWLPDGDHLFVSKLGAPGTWTMSVSDGTVRKFREETIQPYPSPDGRQLAFDKDSDEIWIMGAAGQFPRKVVSVGSPWILENLAWSPTGRRIAYVKLNMLQADQSKTPGIGGKGSLESCDLDGRCSTLLSESRLTGVRVSTLVWLPDSRIIFVRRELPPNESESNLWSLATDPNSGQSLGELKRLTNWSGTGQVALTASTNGKRLIVQQLHAESIVKIAEIRADGGGLGLIKPLKSETWLSRAAAWTRDSKAVLFTARSYGKTGIFAQNVNASSSRVLVSGPGHYDTPVISPDGEWLLYMERFEDGSARLMRMPIQVGPATLVIAGNYGYRCASAPATLCILSEFSGKQVVFSVLDPLNGRGRELARADVRNGPHGLQYGWSLSPDGKHIALVNNDEDQVRIIGTDSGNVRTVPLKGWTILQHVNWTADGSHLYISGGRDVTETSAEWAILEADLAGNFKVWIQVPNNQGWVANPIPSPDGRYLIFTEKTWPSSVLMLEDF